MIRIHSREFGMTLRVQCGIEQQVVLVLGEG